MEHQVRILSIGKVTHDVLQIVTEKPPGYTFTPGQAADLSITKPDWANEKRPFTFTCLPENEYLEFTIKTYPSREGLTNQLMQLKRGDELILHEVFGDIAYKGEGVFIAGGAGVTPFISIFRDLHAKNSIGNNKLIFANKTKADIIREEEFKNMLGENFINILSAEKTEEYAYGYITEEFLRKHISEYTEHFYVCGPPPMMEAVEKHLAAIGINQSLIVEETI